MRKFYFAFTLALLTVSSLATQAHAACTAPTLGSDLVLRFPASLGVWAGAASSISSESHTSQVFNEAGVLYYDATAKALKFCDGDDWVTLDGSGGAAAGAVGEVQFKGAGDSLAADAGFVWDNATKRLGIGTQTPVSPIHIVVNNLDHSLGLLRNNITFDAYISSPSSGGIAWRKARGTQASPQAVALNDYLFNFGAIGYGATKFSDNSTGNFNIRAEEAWTDTAHGTYMTFETTPTGSTARAESLRITGDGRIGVGTTTPNALLHVAGGIKLEDDVDTCPGTDNVKLGTLRFNTGALQICQSAGWTDVGTGTGSGSMGLGPDISVSMPADQSLVNTCEFAGNPTITVPKKALYFISITGYGYMYSGNIRTLDLKFRNSSNTNIFTANYGFSSTSGQYIHVQRDGLLYLNAGTYNFAASANDSSSCSTTNFNRLISANVKLKEVLGGGSSGSGPVLTNLGDLDDVDVSGASNGQALVYNSTTSTWEPGGTAASAAGNTGEVQFKSASGNLAASEYFAWDDTNKRLTLGDGAATTALQVNGRGVFRQDSGGLGLIIERSSGVANQPARLGLIRSRGTAEAPEDVVDNDELASLDFQGYRGGEYTKNGGTSAAAIRAQVNGTVTSTSIPTALTFHTTAEGATSNTERLRITSDGNVGIGTTAPTSRLNIHNGTLTISQNGGGGLGLYLKQTGDLTNNNLPMIMWDNEDDPDVTRRFMIRAQSTGLNFWSTDSGSYDNSITNLTLKGDGKVGIGTTTPTARLSVASPGNALTDYTADFQSSDSSAGAGGILFSQGSTYAYKWHTQSTAFNTGFLKLSYITRETGEPLYDNIITFRNGNVGIGMDYPAYKLNVNGALNATSVLVNGVPVATSTDTYWSNAGSGKIQYSGGNVGIGTATPVAPLHVNHSSVTAAPHTKLYHTTLDSLVVTGGMTGSIRMIAANDTATSAGQFGGIRVRGTVDTPLAVEANDRLFHIFAQGYDGTNRLTAASIYFDADAAPSDDQLPGRIRFGVNNGTALTEAMRITSAGNVGIGTSTPSGRLHVNDGQLLITGTPQNLWTTSSWAVALETMPGRAFVWSGTDISKPTFGIGMDTAGRFHISHSATYDTAGVPSIDLIIDTNSYVGLGTETPQARLHVAGGIKLEDDTDTCPGASNVKLGTLRFNTGALQICQSGGWTAVGGGSGSGDVTGPATSTARAVPRFADTTGKLLDESHLSVSNVGGVAIGGTQPGLFFKPSPDTVTRIAISNPSPTDASRQLVMLTYNEGYTAGSIGSMGVGGAAITNEGGPLGFGIATGHYLSFANGVNERARITDAGRFGLGKSAPSSRLHVASGGATLADYTAEFESNNSVPGAGGILFSQGATYAYKVHTQQTSSSTAGALHFSMIERATGTVVNDSILQLRNNNVGIGLTTTTAPLAKLHVAGGIKLEDDTDACPGASNVKLGTLRFNTGALQICQSGGWTGIKTGGAGKFVDGTTATDAVYTAGKVGIGTTTPVAALDVRGLIRAGNDVATKGSLLLASRYLPMSEEDLISSIGTEFSTGAININYGVRPKSEAAGYVSTHDASSIRQSSLVITNGVLNFLSASSDSAITKGDDVSLVSRLYIAASGYAGIGTSSPRAVLHVAGGIKLEADPDACPGASNVKLGTLRFNSGTLQVCQGTAWTPIATGAAGKFVDGTTATDAVYTAGNVGIGITNPAAKLHIHAASGSPLLVYSPSSAAATILASTFSSPKNTVSMFISSHSDGSVAMESTAAYTVNESSGNIRFNGLGTTWGDFGYYPKGGGDGNLGQFRFSTATSSINTTPNAKVGVGSLYSAGNVGIGTTSPRAKLDIMGGGAIINIIALEPTSANTARGIRLSDAGYIWAARNTADDVLTLQQLTTGAAGLAKFYSKTVAVGSITTNGTGTAYNTTSDARLKENVTDSARGIDTLMRIDVKDFNFISDDAKERVQGFIAQQLHTVYPEAVTVGGDSINEPWNVDYGRLTPLIVKSIQDLKLRNDTLQAENDNLNRKINDLQSQMDAMKSAIEKLQAAQ